jgi:hypothetical protein
MIPVFNLFGEPTVQETSDHLAFTLKLKIKGKEHKVPGGNVKDCQLDCQLYGFNGSLLFSLPNDVAYEDKLVKDFIKEDLIEVELGIMPVFNLPKPPPKPFVVKGIVTEKLVQEEIYDELKKPKVLYRHYRIKFADPAQVIWQQHYPCELYVKQTMEQVIKAQLTSHITLKMNLPALKTKHPMICLGLAYDDKLNNGTHHRYNQASFYDFFIEYADTHHAHFYYDYQKHTYQISTDRPKPEKTEPFLPMEILRVTSYWQESKRYQAQLLNAIAKSPKKETLSQKEAIEGVRHDHLLREHIASRLNTYKESVKTKLKNHGEKLDIHFSRWPVQTFTPGSTFSVNKKVWSQDPLYAQKKYRTLHTQIHASRVYDDTEADIHNTSTAYRLRYQTQDELTDCDKPSLPSFTPVAYPVQVEGVVVSTVGGGTDKTYDYEKNKETSKDQYKVKIPLWDKTILIQAKPDTMNPHFYFPHYRNTQLLLNMELYRASIKRVLEWGERVPLPLSTQGNHLLMGKNKDNETSIKHIYEGENPALLVKRKKEADNEQIKLKQGTLILETNWEE